MHSCVAVVWLDARAHCSPTGTSSSLVLSPNLVCHPVCSKADDGTLIRHMLSDSRDWGDISVYVSQCFRAVIEGRVFFLFSDLSTCDEWKF